MKQELKQFASNAALAAVAVIVLFGLACCTQSAYADSYGPLAPVTTTAQTVGPITSSAISGPGLYNFTGYGASAANTGNASVGLYSQTRGTGAVQTSDILGNLDVFGWTGAAYGYGAALDVVASGIWSATSYPTQFVFNTAPAGSTVQQTVMVVGATGVSFRGTTLANNAGVGTVGEVVTALSASTTTALTTAVAATLTSVTLTAGDWDVSGSCGYLPAATTSVTQDACGVSLVAATMPTLGSYALSTYAAVTPTAVEQVKTTPNVRISVAAPTLVYLVGRSAFTVSTMTGGGTLFARRVR